MTKAGAFHWTPGTYTLPRQRFWALVELVGTFKDACELADALILWPPRQGRPPEQELRRWAGQLQDGTADIPPSVRSQVERQLKSYLDYALSLLAVKNAAAAYRLAQKFEQDGELSEADAGLVTRFNNAAGFIAGTVKGGRQSQVAGEVGSKLKINAGPKKLGPGKKPSTEPIDIRGYGNG